jgi:hypothetical protein
VAPDLQSTACTTIDVWRDRDSTVYCTSVMRRRLAFGRMISQIERVVSGVRVGPARGVHMGRHASCRVGRTMSTTGSDSVSFLHPKEIQDVI